MATTTIQISGLDKQKVATLREQAKTLGMSAEVYARHLIEEGMTLELQARTKTFDELFDPAQARFRKSRMSEQDLDQLVNAARSRHRRHTAGKKG